MKVQHLLLLALVGPFCAFTWAGPTTVPTDRDNTGTTEMLLETIKENLSVITGPAPTDPTAVPNVAAEPSLPPTTVFTDILTTVMAKAPEASTKLLESFTIKFPAEETTASADIATDSERPAGTTQEAFAPAEKTSVPYVAIEPEERTEAPVDSQPEVNSDRPTIEDSEQGLSSGQITGIVIGALLAVVIVIAVVIAVVRRMGKYSSAKSKKPAKKDSVMSLKKKSTKQQERAKFWNF